MWTDNLTKFEAICYMKAIKIEREECAKGCDEAAQSLSSCKRSDKNDAAISALKNQASVIRARSSCRGLHMRRLRMIVDLTYDGEVMHGKSPEEQKYFIDECLLRNTGQTVHDDSLYLHSNLLGGTIGAIEVVKILDDEN